MSETQQLQPPQLRRTADGDVDVNSLADLLEWFLANDARVGLVRHPHVEELFQWKQQDDRAHGVEVYPFENAEARFAIGVFQALGENDTEPALRRWITEVLQALGETKQITEDIGAAHQLSAAQSRTAQAQLIPSLTEQRVYLSSAWIEALCTAEVRFLGWVYQQLYGAPFQPLVDE